MQVERASWDSLLVVLHFQPSTVNPMRPERVMVTLFDSGYDTLYTGQDSVVFLPDGRLGSNETVLVEACGVFALGAVCEQKSIHASPKRIEANLSVVFPEDPEQMTKGSYSLVPQIERARFGASGWEPVPENIPDKLEALVRVMDTEDAGVRIPLRLRGGRFDLSGADGFRDFRFYLLSAFRERGEANVEFRVVTSYTNGPLSVGSAVVPVLRKTEEEQAAEVTRLAEAAATRILNRLEGFSGSRRAYVFVNDWEWQADSRSYRAEVEVHWRPRGSRRWLEMVGRLDTKDDGTAARFGFLRGNDRARDVWRDRVEGRDLPLDVLETADRTPSAREIPRW